MSNLKSVHDAWHLQDGLCIKVASDPDVKKSSWYLPLAMKGALKKIHMEADSSVGTKSGSGLCIRGRCLAAVQVL